MKYTAVKMPMLIRSFPFSLLLFFVYYKYLLIYALTFQTRLSLCNVYSL